MPLETLNYILDATRAKPCGCDRWMGHCVSHGSRKHRDLSIRRTDDRILLYDFAGCSLHEICGALGIQQRDVFLHTPLPRRSPSIPKPPRLDRRGIALDFELHAILLQERSEKTLQAASGLDCTSWSEKDFNKTMHAVGRAYHDLTHAENLFATADRLRERAYQEEHHGAL